MSGEQGLGRLHPVFKGGAAKDLHDLVYVVSEESGISASKMFQAIYTSIRGKKSGPRAGYFMASLNRAFLVDRLRAAGGESAGWMNDL